jgi:hypothetical protein
MTTLDAAEAAWAALLGLPTLGGLSVLVRPESPLSPTGWIGILRVGGTVTATVPHEGLRLEVEDALARVTIEQSVIPSELLIRLPTVEEVMGPAALFYPENLLSWEQTAAVEEVPVEELALLLESADSSDVEESGLAEITGTASVLRSPSGVPIAAGGYRVWPNQVANLSILTSPAHRREGHGAAVASAAIEKALGASLLPQWRARPMTSRALAAKLGLVELGAQLNLRPASLSAG